MKNIQLELQNKLAKIQQVFDISKILRIKPTAASIADYYKLNKLAYTLFHHNDFIHMGISRKGKYAAEDLLEQARVVEKYIRKTGAKNILELATGRGATSFYLAKKYPDIYFEGIDLPGGQTDFALTKAKEIKNLHITQGNYHNLKNYPSHSMDIVFIIEALCYNTDKQRVFKEIKRVLRPNGVFIIFDAYCGKQESSLNKEELLAKHLIEKSMLVPVFDHYKDFKNLITKSKYKIIEEEDCSLLIMPTLKRFENLAKFYFEMPSLIRKLANKLVPPKVIYNAVAGYLMPVSVKLGIAKYMILITKPFTF